ncbi:MAG: hypothetical protein ACR2PX_07575 [Endozoicomonas sp.]|uniref:hypothetical protein n=1 Tax=Endozoicomonas sp. TaxID=1892382 RepID=UPI003D9B47CC
MASGTIYRATQVYGREDYDDITVSSSNDKAIPVEINTGTYDVCRRDKNTITSTLHFIKRELQLKQNRRNKLHTPYRR